MWPLPHLWSPLDQSASAGGDLPHVSLSRGSALAPFLRLWPGEGESHMVRVTIRRGGGAGH